MKTVKIAAVVMVLLSFSGSGFAQGFGVAVDDGAALYARDLARFHGSSVENLLKKNDLEPFAVSFFGWRALTIARLPFNKLEGTHLDVCRLGLSIYDKELDATLQALATRPTQMTSSVEATEAEKSAIQKFVVQKYGAKYFMDLNDMRSSFEKGAEPKKMDETAKWKYTLGAVMGELAGSVVKWFWFPNNPKYDEAIYGYLVNLDKELKRAPKDAPAEMLASLRQLAALGNKKFFQRAEREQIGATIKQALPTTLGLAKPLSSGMQNLANAMEGARPKPTTPTTPTAPTTDAAKAKEVAEQYRQQGLLKYNNKLYDPAIGDFDRAAAANPTDPRIYGSRGRTYLAKGDADSALADFTRAINLGGVTAEDYFYLNDRARAYFAKRDSNAAIADLNRAISLNAKNVYGYYLRGFIHRVGGNMAQARADQQAALNLDPNYQPAKDELAKLR